METKPPYTTAGQEEEELCRPIINVFDRPEIHKNDFRRMRSIALNLIAFAEAHEPSESLAEQITELKEIIHGSNRPHPST